ncbi:hypothetical protein O9929_21865 [Vibrio lentus]|nr:hypothetical protein [Vibrio lentus]
MRYADLVVTMVLHGSNSGRRGETERLSAEHGFTFVPPFDHPLVVTGQRHYGHRSAAKRCMVISLCSWW